MKWFKHESDAHTNTKLQTVIEQYGLAAYGYYWACLELVAKEGENYRIKRAKEWQFMHKKFLNVDVDLQKQYLAFFAKKDLIDKEALRIGDLYIPKLAERCDEYTEKKRRVSRQGTEDVGLEEKRTEEEKNRREETFARFWSAYPNKEGKKKAKEKWDKHSHYLHIDAILAFIEKAKETDRWKKKRMIKQPTTFLNGECWNDELGSYNDKGSQPSNSLNQGSDYRSDTLKKLNEKKTTV